VNKYGAKRQIIDGIKFASLAESRRYGELKLLSNVGQISHLQCHPRFELQPAFRCQGKWYAAVRYTADFSYVCNGDTVVEEVKGGKATITTAYSIRKRLFLYKYGSTLEFREVME